MQALWNSNPDAVRSLLKARPRNSAVPIEAIGHDGDRDLDSEEETLAALFPDLHPPRK
jgi:hypothetical protein